MFNVMLAFCFRVQRRGSNWYVFKLRHQSHWFLLTGMFWYRLVLKLSSMLLCFHKYDVLIYLHASNFVSFCPEFWWVNGDVMSWSIRFLYRSRLLTALQHIQKQFLICNTGKKKFIGLLLLFHAFFCPFRGDNVWWCMESFSHIAHFLWPRVGRG